MLGIRADCRSEASVPVMVKAFINSFIFLAQFQGCAKYTLHFFAPETVNLYTAFSFPCNE
jgi:hypothetical protein